MNYHNKDTLSAYFKSVIEAEVKAQTEQLQADIDRLKYEAQVSIENNLKEEQENTLRMAEAEMNRSYHLKLAAYQRELDINVMKKRNESIQILFRRLKEFLAAYIHTPEYEKWVDAQFKSRDLSDIQKIHIDAKDTKIKEFIDSSIPIEIKDGILGGAILFEKSGKKIIDLSFRNRLEEAEEWFYSHVKWPTSGEAHE